MRSPLRVSSGPGRARWATDYVEAGADVLFIEAPRTMERMAIVGATGSRSTLLLNLVEGGRTPLPDQKTIAKLGYKLAIFPGSAVRALVPALVRLFDTILRDGSTEACPEDMIDFTRINGDRHGSDDREGKAIRLDLSIADADWCNFGLDYCQQEIIPM